MDGILPIYKPAGITSYDVIRQAKRVLQRGHKIGHAGTLDPFAEGVLLLLLGKATKKFDEIQGWRKTYRAVAKLGAKSDTMDREGEIVNKPTKELTNITINELQTTATKYLGEIEQEVPAYAAAKYKGRKLYEYAREGKAIPPKSKKVMIYSIEVIAGNNYHYSNNSSVVMRVVCGSGTYIRQLSYDILKELGVESYLEKLVRESVGQITLSGCVKSDLITDVNMVEQRLLPVPGE